MKLPTISEKDKCTLNITKDLQGYIDYIKILGKANRLLHKVQGTRYKVQGTRLAREMM